MSRKEILTQPSLIALLIAEIVSTTGSQMTWLALPWFVLVTTGSATKTTLVMTTDLGGLALLGLPRGRLIGWRPADDDPATAGAGDARDPGAPDAGSPSRSCAQSPSRSAPSARPTSRLRR